MSTLISPRPDTDTPIPPADALGQIWQHAGLPPEALEYVRLGGTEPMLPSSFAVGAAAQASIAAAALAAAEVRHAWGLPRQVITVDMRHAAQESSNYLRIDGVVPALWDKLSGLYPCGEDAQRGWVRIHANFRHHREGALRLLGCTIGDASTRDDVTAALRGWNAEDFEQTAADANLVVAAVRRFDPWDQHSQGRAVAGLPLMSIEKIGEAPPRPLPALGSASRPLAGVRWLDHR